jgi:hypothetical protein
MEWSVPILVELEVSVERNMPGEANDSFWVCVDGSSVGGGHCGRGSAD